MFLRISDNVLVNTKCIVEAEQIVSCGKYSQYRVTLTMRNRKLYEVYGDYAHAVWAVLTKEK